MAYRLHVSAQAENDTLNALDYYDQISPLLGDRFLSELLDTYQRIKANPQYYSYISSNPADKFRDTKLKYFSYVVIYEVDEMNVFISAVLHTSRKPFTPL